MKMLDVMKEKKTLLYTPMIDGPKFHQSAEYEQGKPGF